MDYIETMLGMQVKYQPWAYTAELPYYILDRYDIRQATIGTVKALFIYPKAELEQMAAVKKQIIRIQRLERLPVVIVMENINRNRRDYLVSAKIPFVISDKQLYLPFMGVALQDKFEAEVQIVEQLQPATQVLFFYYLYQKKEQLSMSEATKKLRFSAMTITRAFRQLEQTKCFISKKDGVRKYLIGRYKRRELFEKMQRYLISPIRKTIYIKKQTALPEAWVAGLSALSEKSLINPPSVACYAVNGSHGGLTGTDVLMDAATQVEIEVWKYDPRILAEDGVVDVLSLLMTFRESQDERIEEAMEGLLAGIWED